MKNYDDLQRFKEKTQTLDIAFKDMSGQTQEAAELSQWALIRQLANSESETPFESSQRIDLPQPQPIRGDEFSASAPNALSRPTVQPASAARGSILDSLATSTSAAVSDAAPASGVSSLFPAPLAKPQPVEAVAAPQSTIQPASAAFQSMPAAPAAPAVSTKPGRFGALFRSRNSEPASLSKETLLKPLLEKIALCR